LATFVEFEVFSEDLCNKLHDLNTDSFKWYFTDTAPTASGDSVKADLPAELANGNGYTTGGLASTLSFSRTGNQTTVSGTQVVLTATGAVGPVSLSLQREHRERFIDWLSRPRFVGYDGEYRHLHHPGRFAVHRQLKAPR
jgi:hypothetical protein